jgi:hypothetical protein
MADFHQKFDHFQQAVNYFTTIEEAESFWLQKVGTSLFGCIQKAKGDEKILKFSSIPMSKNSSIF